MRNYIQLLSMLGLGSSICLIGSLTIFYVYGNVWILLLGLISLMICVLSHAGNFMLSDKIRPVLAYLEAVLHNKTLMIIEKSNKSLHFIVGDNEGTSIDVKKQGTFVASPNPVKSFTKDVVIDERAETQPLGSVPTYVVYEETCVPYETDLVKLCDRLAEANINSIDEYKEKLKKNENPIYVKDLDMKVVTRYFEYNNPHYLASRVETIRTELRQEFAQAWMKVLPWVSIMIVLMMMAALAFVIINSVTSGDTSSAPSIVPTINT